MAGTLLQIVKDAADELGNIARPSAVYSSSDRAVQRMLVLSNREGRDLAKEFEWTVLQRLHTFTTTSGTAEYALPSDFDRLIRNSEWDRSKYEPLIGPLSPQEWQRIKSGLIGSGLVGRRYRIYRSDSSTDRTFRLDPTPTVTGDTLAFEYVSSNWCQSSGGTAQSAWAADTDISLMDRDLMTLGLIVRFKRAVGLDFASEADEYAAILSRAKGHDRPAPILSMAPQPLGRLLGVANLPETGLGS